MIAKILESAPRNATHWSTRLMATGLGMSQSAVSWIWRASGLQPYRQDSWKLSKDPVFVDNVKDVVGLYLDPPERAVVLCGDEKSQIQALDPTAPILPMRPGTPERATHDYKRHGASSLCAALDLASGQVIGSLHSCHRAIENKKFPATIDREVPEHLDVHLVMDNASTHRTPAVQRWLLAHPRFDVPFTPTSSSWLNLVERWSSELTTKKLRRGAHQRPRAQRRHPQLDHDLDRESPALRADQDLRPDPRVHRPLLRAHYGLRTLGRTHDDRLGDVYGVATRGFRPRGRGAGG